ncbi:MAG: acyltransferase [Rhodanobacter sp.]|jgi:peptidoglycan/LPS O-acetylase OafA/YrhL|nr:acyltransferase [Rhodanobacter sp.]
MKEIKTIEYALGQGGDNFLLLRFIAASLVIYGHAPAISGGYAPVDIFVYMGWSEYSGAIAVDIFFIVSGFLVTGSFSRRQHLIDFVWARFIRIMPAYTACLLLSAFLIGPLFSTHSFKEYILGHGVYDYVWTNLHLGVDMRWDLPGVFTGNPQRTTVNGSIWTLPAEVRMYALVALFGLVGAIRWRWLFNIALFALFVFGSARPHHIPMVPIDSYIQLAALFGIGGFCYMNRSWIPVHGGLLLAASLVAWLLRSTVIYPAVFAICEVLFVFWFAYNTRWYGFNRFGDYSYGIYLWGFPMQQIVAVLAPLLPALLNALFGFLAALSVAVMSWHVIEKPALRLKGAPRALLGWITAVFR